MNDLFQVHLVSTDKLATKEQKAHALSIGEWGLGFGYQNGKHHHLYITSNEEIKEGDWVIHNGKIKKIKGMFEGENSVNLQIIFHDEEYNGYLLDCESIVATTNKELWTREGSKETYHIFTGIGNIPQSFIDLYIKRYNAGDPIKEVRLEILQILDTKLMSTPGDKTSYINELKLTPEGYVIVKPEFGLGEMVEYVKNSSSLKKIFEEAGFKFKEIVKPEEERMFPLEALKKAFEDGDDLHRKSEYNVTTIEKFFERWLDKNFPK